MMSVWTLLTVANPQENAVFPAAIAIPAVWGPVDRFSPETANERIGGAQRQRSCGSGSTVATTLPSTMRLNGELGPQEVAFHVNVTGAFEEFVTMLIPEQDTAIVYD